MTELTTPSVHVHRIAFRVPDDGWLVGSSEMDESAGGLSVEHGRLALMGGTVVAESFQTRLTAER